MDFDAAREAMVDRQIAARGIADDRIFSAMRAIPREKFVPEHLAERAYEDGALPIGEDQTISQPFIVALMAEAAAIGEGDRVLEVGAGSGYAAAVFGQLAKEVFGIERYAVLAEAAAKRIAAIGAGNVTISQGDGSKGLPSKAPFDAIIVSAAADEMPAALRDQLADGGRLVIPVGPRRWSQKLLKFTRQGSALEREELGGVRFVPLIED